MWAKFRARKIEIDEFRTLIQKLDVFLPASRTDMDKVRGNLTEVLMAQGYQDLSGQIIRGVMKLVSELETALVDLVRLSRTGPGALPIEKPAERRHVSRIRSGSAGCRQRSLGKQPG